MILVTGASGNVGKAVLHEVARSGAKHKAMYRSANEAGKAPAGREAVVADFAKKETLVPALRDVDAGTSVSFLAKSATTETLVPALRDVDAVYLVCSPI